MTNWNDPQRECHCRIDEPMPGQEATFDAGDRKLMADIRSHGWHIVQIPDDPMSSGWVFSVGMWHTLGSPDLVVFGMAPKDAAHLINLIGDRVHSGQVLGSDVVLRDVLEEDRPVTFRPVDTSWYHPMLGYAIWFGRRPPLPVAQVVWADAQGRFPWDDGLDDSYRGAQLSAWVPADEHPQGLWSGARIEGSWPFPDPPDTTAFTTRRIAFERHPVLYVVHDADGDWQFLDGTDVAPADATLVHMAHVVGAQPGVIDLADLPRGWEAFRASQDGQWQRRARTED